VAHRRRLVAVAALAVLLGAAGGCARTGDKPPAPRTGSVWVADEGANSLSVINASSDTVAMTVAGITAPHNVQVSRDGSVVYATSSAGLVIAIDPATYRITATAPTGAHPAHVIEAPNGKVYVTNADDGTVSVYQGRDLVPAGRITVGGMPHGQRPAAGGSLIVIANMMENALDLIDSSTDQPIGAVPVGTSPVQVAVTADGQFAYTGISDPPSVVKVDLAQRKVVASTSVPSTPVQLYLSPDETTVLSADQGSREAPGNTLSVIDSAAMTTRATVATGSGPHGVVIDESGSWAWVTNSFDNTVSVVDLAGLTVVATIPVGTAPNGVSFSPTAPAPAPTTATTLTIPAPPGQADHSAGNDHEH
jgi:YVTN family beta-propeller protein